MVQALVAQVPAEQDFATPSGLVSAQTGAIIAQPQHRFGGIPAVIGQAGCQMRVVVLDFYQAGFRPRRVGGRSA